MMSFPDTLRFATAWTTACLLSLATAIAADPAHPQHLLARLLARLEVAPAQVLDWSGSYPPDRSSRAGGGRGGGQQQEA